MSDVTLTASANDTLLTLRRGGREFAQTQTDLNSGRKVNSVVDNAVTYFRASALSARATALQSRKTQIDQNIQALSATLVGTNAVANLLRQLQGVAEGAKGGTPDARKSATQQFLNISRQLAEVVKDTSYQGLNLLVSTNASLQTQFSERTAATLVINGVKLLTTVGGNQTSLFPSSPGVFDSQGNLVFSNLVGVPVLPNPPQTYSYDYIQQFTVPGSQTYSRVYSNQSVIPAFLSFGAHGSITANPSKQITQEFIQNPVTSGSYQVGGFSALDDPSEQGQVVEATYNLGQGLHGSNVLAGQQYSGSATFPNEAQRVSQIISNRLDTAITQINAVSSSLVVNIAILKARSEFSSTYTETLQNGSDTLTLADLNEAAANSQALALNQQLGIQSLALSGQQNQSILQLLK